MPGMRGGVRTFASVCSNCRQGCNPIGFIVGPNRDLEGVWYDKRKRRRTDVISNGEMITIPVCYRQECWVALRKKHPSQLADHIMAKETRGSE